MSKVIAILVAAFSVEAGAAEKVGVLFANLSTPPATATANVLAKKSIEATPDASFVKLSVALEKPTDVSAVEIESCQGDFKDGIDLFTNPGFRRTFVEGGKSKVKMKVVGDVGRLMNFALVFRHNSSLCIKSVRLMDRQNKELALIEGSARLAAPNVKGPEAGAAVSAPKSQKILAAFLDQELASNEDDRWIFRFRADGTFFVRGYNDDISTAREFSALGSYEVISQKKNSVKMKLTGRKVVTAIPWDGVICESDCANPAFESAEVLEEIEVEPDKGSIWMVRNRTARGKRTLAFSDLKTKTTSLSE